MKSKEIDIFDWKPPTRTCSVSSTLHLLFYRLLFCFVIEISRCVMDLVCKIVRWWRLIARKRKLLFFALSAPSFDNPPIKLFFSPFFLSMAKMEDSRRKLTVLFILRHQFFRKGGGRKLETKKNLIYFWEILINKFLFYGWLFMTHSWMNRRTRNRNQKKETCELWKFVTSFFLHVCCILKELYDFKIYILELFLH